MALDTKEPEIHLTLGAADIQVEVFNVQGTGCKLLSKPYEDLFSTVTDQPKAEMHERAKESTSDAAKLSATA